MRKTVLIALAAVALLLSQPAAPSWADSTPVVTLVGASSMSVPWETLRVTIHFEGGWATSISSCDQGDLRRYVLPDLALTNATGHSFDVVSPQVSGLKYWWGWNTTITSNGLDCTLDFAKLQTAPSLSVYESGEQVYNPEGAQALLQNPDSGRLHVGLQWFTNNYLSQQVQWLTPPDGLSVRSVSPQASIEGIDRGQLVDYVVDFHVRVVEHPELPVTNIDGNGVYCDNPVPTPNPDASIQLLYSCWKILGSANPTFAIDVVTSSTRSTVVSPAMDVRSTGALSISIDQLALTHTPTGGSERFRVTISAVSDFGNTASPIPFPLGDAEVFYSVDSGTAVRVPVNVEASSTTIAEGEVTIPFHFGLSQLKFTGTLHGIPLIDVTNSQQPQREVLMQIDFPKPMKLPKLTVKVSIKAPKVVHWPKAFNVQVITKGKGSATCLSYFQGSLYRFTVTQGSGTLTISPSFLSAKGSLLKIQCSPLDWPSPSIAPPTLVRLASVAVLR